jgi:anti-anti-sigma regulatory factor
MRRPQSNDMVNQASWLAAAPHGSTPATGVPISFLGGNRTRRCRAISRVQCLSPRSSESAPPTPRKRLNDLSSGGVRDLAVDLSDVDFLDERGPLILGEAINRARQQRHRLVAISGPSPISHILESSGIARFLPTYPSAGELPSNGNAQRPTDEYRPRPHRQPRRSER